MASFLTMMRLFRVVKMAYRVGAVFETHLRALTQPGSPLEKVGSEDFTHPTRSPGG